MIEKRSKADLEFGRLLKEVIDNSPEELDFFKQMSKVEVPPPETFMIGPPGFTLRRRRRIRNGLIVGAIASVFLVTALYIGIGK